MSRKKIFLIGGGVLLIALLVYANMKRQSKSATKVETQKVEELELRAIVSASGKIRAKTSVDISANATGKVVKLAVDEGDKVTKGQFLMQIDPTAAEANVRQIEANIKSAEAALKLAQANFEQAEFDFTRQEQLYEKKLTSQELLQKSRTAYNVAKLQVESSKQDLARLQAALRNAQHELSKVNVHSDISGIVVKRNIEEGENVFVGAFNNPATVLLTIADLNVIEAEIEVDETDIVDVRVGQEATVKVDAYPDTSFKAVVTKVGHSPILSASGISQQQATSFEVILQLTEVIPDVRPGLSCKADITTGYREKAIAVPIQALTTRRPADLVPLKERMKKKAPTDGTVASNKEDEKEIQGAFVVKDGVVEFHEVRTGIAGERHFEVLSGLQAGDEVVTAPFSALRRLHNGDAVKAEAKKRTET